MHFEIIKVRKSENRDENPEKRVKNWKRLQTFNTFIKN